MTTYKEQNDKIDYDALRWLLEHMNSQHLLYKLVRSEMMRRGNWKNKPRGSGFQKGYDPKRKSLSPVTEEAVEEVEEEAVVASKRLLLRRKDGNI